MKKNIIERPTARVVLLDKQNHILLFKIQHKQTEGKPIFWMTPGGGIEEGESPKDAALRELWEETGIKTVTIIEPAVWYGEIVIHWDNKDWLLKQHFFIAYTDYNKPVINTNGLTAIEKETYCDYKWWPTAELKSSNEQFIPKQLYHLLQPIIEEKAFPASLQIIDL